MDTVAPLVETLVELTSNVTPLALPPGSTWSFYEASERPENVYGVVVPAPADGADLEGISVRVMVPWPGDSRIVPGARIVVAGRTWTIASPLEIFENRKDSIGPDSAIVAEFWAYPPD